MQWVLWILYCSVVLAPHFNVAVAAQASNGQEDGVSRWTAIPKAEGSIRGSVRGSASSAVVVLVLWGVLLLKHCYSLSLRLHTRSRPLLYQRTPATLTSTATKSRPFRIQIRVRNHYGFEPNLGGFFLPECFTLTTLPVETTHRVICSFSSRSVSPEHYLQLTNPTNRLTNINTLNFHILPIQKADAETS